MKNKKRGALRYLLSSPLSDALGNKDDSPPSQKMSTLCKTCTQPFVVPDAHHGRGFKHCTECFMSYKARRFKINTKPSGPVLNLSNPNWRKRVASCVALQAAVRRFLARRRYVRALRWMRELAPRAPRAPHTRTIGVQTEPSEPKG